MKTLALLLTKKSIPEASVASLQNDHLFKQLELPDKLGFAYLYNEGIDLDAYLFEESDYLYMELNDTNEINFSGNWLEGLDSEYCSINGSMTFIISELEDQDHYYDLKDLYGGLWYKHNQEVVDLFMSYGSEFVRNFLENTDEDNPENIQIDSIWKLIRELADESGEDYDTVIQTLVISHTFNQLGIRINADEEKLSLVCSLDGMLPVKTFLLCKDILDDEMSELQEGDTFQFAYSLWTGSHNLGLFEDLGLDNGDYISYPTLKTGEYKADPESGTWY